MLEKLEKEYGGHWKELVDYPGYYVSDFGEVYGMSKGGLLNKSLAGKKTIRVEVRHCGGERKTKTVASLVAEAFVSNPEGKPYVFHKDTNSMNNSADNLMWVTAKEQHNLMAELGLMENAYTEETKNEARELYRTGEYSQRQLADRFGVSARTIKVWLKGVKKENINLREEDKRKACEMYVTGEYKQSELAERFGVHPSTIGRWLKKAGLTTKTQKPKCYSTEVPDTLKDCEGERWESIDGYPGYFVSDLGRVYSEKRKGRMLAPAKNKYGYMIVNFSDNGKKHTFTVHKLVAEAFVTNPDPENKDQVNHINGEKEDNRAANLEWMTSKENIRHSGDAGLNPTHHTSELRKKVVEHQKRGNCTYVELSDIYNVSVSTICKWVREEAEEQSDQNKTTEQEA